MTERLDAAVAPLGVAPGAVRVRTFHALGPRDPARRRRRRRAAGRPRGGPGRGRAVGRRGRRCSGSTRVDLAAQGRARRRRPTTSPPTRTPGRSPARSSPTSAAVAATRRARLRRPHPARDRARSRRDPALLARWRGRCRELLVDEVQDVDRAQLRLALLLAAPANRIFLVGDDDQSIYGWRLADVRRILGLEALAARAAPGRPRGQLPLPAPGRRAGRPARRAQRRAVREGDPGRPGGDRPARSSRPTPSDETVRLERAIRTWPDDGSTRAVLARTNRELLPAVVVALRARAAVPGAADRPARSSRRWSTTCSTRPSGRRRRAASRCSITLGRVRATCAERRAAARDDRRRRSSAGRSAVADLAALRGRRSRETRAAARRAAPRRRAADAGHGPRDEGPRVRPRHRHRHGGRPLPERAGGQPGRRSRSRAYEEERRLAYVAWTRARRSLTLLVRPGGPLAVPARGVQPGRAGLRRASGRPARSAVARLSSRISRSIESRNGSVSDSGRTSRIESLTP